MASVIKLPPVTVQTSQNKPVHRHALPIKRPPRRIPVRADAVQHGRLVQSRAGVRKARSARGPVTGSRSLPQRQPLPRWSSAPCFTRRSPGWSWGSRKSVPPKMTRPTSGREGLAAGCSPIMPRSSGLITGRTALLPDRRSGVTADRSSRWRMHRGTTTVQEGGCSQQCRWR